MALAGSLFGLASLVGGTIIGTVLAQGLMLIAFLVGGAGAFFAFKAFLLQIELALIVMLSPLSFSLLGLNALRDQGISPFKSLIALVYRMLLYGVIFGALFTMLDVVKDVIDHYTSLNWDTAKNIWHGGKDIMKAIMGAIGGEFLLLMLLWKADSIASTLAGGSSSLGGADMAGAVAAGVAAGMGAHSAAQAMARPAQGMGDIMRGLMGRGGMDMRDVSSQGAGSPGESLTDMAKPDMGGSMSLGEEGNGSTGAGSGPSEAVGNAGSGKSQLPPNPNEFNGVPNPVVTGDTRNASRDAAREARRQARTGGSIGEPSIGGSGSNDEAFKQLADALSKPKSLGDRLGNANQHAAQERATTSVHINTHHE